MEPTERSIRRKQLAAQCREIAFTVPRLVRQFVVLPSDMIPSFEDTAEYKQSVELWQKFEMKEQVDYKPVVEYATRLAESYERTDKSLDDKADSIVKYLGGGTAIITAGVLLGIKTDSTRGCILSLVAITCLAPSYYFTIRAVRAAINARRPQNQAALKSVSFAIEMAEHHKEQSKFEPNFYMIFHPICEGAYIRNEGKARLVDRSHTYYMRSIFCLAIPAIAIAITLFVMVSIPPSPPPKEASSSQSSTGPTPSSPAVAPP